MITSQGLELHVCDLVLRVSGLELHVGHLVLCKLAGSITVTWNYKGSNYRCMTLKYIGQGVLCIAFTTYKTSNAELHAAPAPCVM